MRLTPTDGGCSGPQYDGGMLRPATGGAVPGLLGSRVQSAQPPRGACAHSSAGNIQGDGRAAQGRRVFDPENLKRWETEKRLPIPAWHETIAEAFELPVEEVRRAVAASRQHRRQQGEENTEVDRRRFIGTAAAVAGIVALPGIAQAQEGINGALSGRTQGTSPPWRAHSSGTRADTVAGHRIRC